MRTRARIRPYRFPGGSPPEASAEEISERARRAQSGTLRSIRLTAAHGHDLPLWEFGPVDLDLSAVLLERLKVWTAEWYAYADAAMEPDPPRGLALDPAWFDTGVELTRDLAREVWAYADVTPDFWNYMNLRQRLARRLRSFFPRESRQIDASQT